MPVVDLDLTRRFPYAGGRVFGDVGAYEQIDAVLTFAVDPSAEVNLSIVDLEHAPLGTDGRVRFTADFSVVRPVNPDRASHLLLVELPNRGRRRVVDTLNRSGKEAAASSDPGDGFLFERGFTVASIGWQWDVHRSDSLMGLSAPCAMRDGLAVRGQTMVEIRPCERVSTWLLADRIHRPMPAAAGEQPEAVLYVRDFEDGEDTATEVLTLELELEFYRHNV